MLGERVAKEREVLGGACVEADRVEGVGLQQKIKSKFLIVSIELTVHAIALLAARDWDWR